MSNYKDLVKQIISETCTHWLISDDADLKKVSKKLTKEFETIINAEIERRQPGSTKNNGLHKHDVSVSLLERAYGLVGHPCTNISAGTDLACEQWRSDYERWRNER